MTRTLTTSTTDRRKLLTSGLAAGLLAASGLSIASTPRVGGRLRAALPGAKASDTWDARLGFGLFMQAIGQGAVFDCLTEVSADGSLRGELATNWEASRDARKWVFDLRKGVRFHNGAVFDSASVVETLRMHMQAGPSGAAWSVVSNIESVRAIGPHQVQFSLHTGNADFPYLLSDRHLILYPAGQIAEAMRDGIGTGLFRVAVFEPGERFVGWRMADHYKDGNAGWFDQIEILAAENPEDRLALLTSGRVDVIGQVDPSHAAAVDASSDLKLASTPGNQHISLDLPNEGAFADETTRQAFRFAVDRNAALFDGVHGYGQPGFDSPIGPFNQNFGWSQPDFDPKHAASLLQNVGPVGLQIETQSAVPLSFASSIWPSLLAVGFVQSTTSKVTARMSSGRVTEDWALQSMQLDPGSEQLRRQAMATFDSSHRSELYTQIQRDLRQSSRVVIPVFTNFLHAVSNRLAQPGTLGNVWPLDNARFAERWWFS